MANLFFIIFLFFLFLSLSSSSTLFKNVSCKQLPVSAPSVPFRFNPSFASAKSILQEAMEKTNVAWLQSIRRKIHEHPELCYEEKEMSRLIRTELERIGISYRWPLVGTGIVARIGTGGPAFVALRADIDALPMQSGSTKAKPPVKCTPVDMMPMSLCFSGLLSFSINVNLVFNVLFIFQAAEEGGARAKRMIEEGALGEAEAIFGIHVSNVLKTGTVGVRSGPFLAGSGFFKAIIIGKGGHAALPHSSIDPILAAASVVLSLQYLVSRESSPMDSLVVSVTMLNARSAYNVIPESVVIGGTFRALTNEIFDALKKRIEEVIVKQAYAHRCKAIVDFMEEEYPFYPPTINDELMSEHVSRVASDVVGKAKVLGLSPCMGGEDFSFYQQVIPRAFYYLGIHNETLGATFSPHSPFFFLDEGVLPLGAAMHTTIAKRYLHCRSNNVTN